MNQLTDDSLPLIEVDADPADRDGFGGFDGASTAASAVAAARAVPSYRVLAWWWIAAATAARLLCVAPLPLGNGEAYYYSWSRFLDWSYYDHPPLVAWMVRVTTLLRPCRRPRPSTSARFSRRAPSALLFYRLAERLLRPRAAFLALVIVSALPVFLASSFVAQPRGARSRLFGWGACWRSSPCAIATSPTARSWRGCCSGSRSWRSTRPSCSSRPRSSTSPSSPPMRRWLRRPSFYAGGLTALFIALPVIAWNVTRGWPSLRLHFVERAGVSVPVAGENTVNQLVAVSSSSGVGHSSRAWSASLVGQLDVVLAAAGTHCSSSASSRALRRFRDRRPRLFVTAFTWPVLLPLLGAMTRPQGRRAALDDGRLHSCGPRRRRASRRSAGPGRSGPRCSPRSASALSGLAFVVANVHAHSTALLNLIPAAKYDPRADMINELAGWSEVGGAMKQAARGASGQVVLASNHYSLCGRLLFETQDSPPTYCPTARRSAFAFFGRQDPPSTRRWSPSRATSTRSSRRACRAASAPSSTPSP